MRITLYLFLFFITTCLVNGETYELHLKFNENAAALFKLRHPFNDSTNNPNYGIFEDCDFNNLEPEWGLADYDDDNPKLIINSIVGGSKITAPQLNDFGACSPIVSVVYGTATCVVEVINWPGMETGTYTKTIAAGEPEWVVTNLPLKKDMGLTIIKAKQQNNNKLKIKAEFAELGLLEEDNSIFRASLESYPETQFWMNCKATGLNKITKAGTVGKFGRPVEAVVKNKNINKQKLTLNKISKNTLQNDLLSVFVTFNNGWSGFQQIQLDDKGKYKAPK